MALSLQRRWDPFRDLASIQSELNRLFDRSLGGTELLGTGAWMPPLDLYEEKDRYLVSVELPGVEPADVDLSVESNTLTIKGERRFYRELEEESFHRMERRYGQFSRSLTLPAAADAEAIEASFDKGVLTIAIPKAEEAKPRRIQIKARA